MRQGILKVTEKAYQEIEASSVKLEIVIEGSHVFYGNAALEKSVEVKEFVKKLDAYKDSLSITIHSIDIKSDTGWLAKSSKGIYRLAVEVKDLKYLSEVLGVIADTKTIQLTEMDWVFEEEAIKLELIKRAVTKAKTKAEAMMSVIDYKVVGIRTCSDSYDSPVLDPIALMAKPAMDNSLLRSKRVSAITMDVGTRIISRKEISCIATMEFYVEPLSV